MFCPRLGLNTHPSSGISGTTVPEDSELLLHPDDVRVTGEFKLSRIGGRVTANSISDASEGANPVSNSFSNPLKPAAPQSSQESSFPISGLSSKGVCGASASTEPVMEGPAACGERSPSPVYLHTNNGSGAAFIPPHSPGSSRLHQHPLPGSLPVAVGRGASGSQNESTSSNLQQVSGVMQSISPHGLSSRQYMMSTLASSQASFESQQRGTGLGEGPRRAFNSSSNEELPSLANVPSMRRSASMVESREWM